MAPEVEYDEIRMAKSDIYSLGACVMDMCYDYQSTSFSYTFCIMRGHFKLTDFIYHKGHPALKKLLEHMTVQRPDKRPSAVEALASLQSSCMSLEPFPRECPSVYDVGKENEQPRVIELDVY